MKIYAALKIIFKKIIISQHVEIEYNDMRKKAGYKPSFNVI